VVGALAADLVHRSTTRVRPVLIYAALTTFVLAWAAAWFLFQLNRMPPYVPGATQDPTFAPPEAIAGLGVVAGALVLPLSAIACVLAFRIRGRALGRALLAAILFVPASHIGPRPNESCTPGACRLITIRSAIWRVYPSGSAERVDLPGADTARWSADIARGTTGPVASPDQRFVAYIRALDVWVYDLAAKTAHQVTRLARPGNETTAATFVWITGWSPAGTRLLVYLDHQEVEDPEGDRPNLAVQPADFGHYTCEVKVRGCSKIVLPGTFRAWFANDQYLLTSDDAVPMTRRLFRYDPESRASIPMGSETDWPSQIDVARSGDRALVLFHQRGVDAHGQILQLDLSTGALAPVSPVGSFAEYQWATYSPSTARVAYVKRGRGSQGTIIVDGALVYECASTVVMCRPFWITDTVIAVQEGVVVLEQGLLRSQTTVLSIVDAGTGRVRAVDTVRVERP